MKDFFVKPIAASSSCENRITTEVFLAVPEGSVYLNYFTPTDAPKRISTGALKAGNIYPNFYGHGIFNGDQASWTTWPPTSLPEIANPFPV